MDSTTAYNGLGKDATVCANEYGVTMLMSITSFSNAAALKADPLVEAGLSEFTAVDLVVCQSATAREAVEVLFHLIDVYGSSEVNIALIYPDLPADMSCVTWESTGPALYGVFVPVSNGAQSISEPYSRNQSAEKTAAALKGQLFYSSSHNSRIFYRRISSRCLSISYVFRKPSFPALQVRMNTYFRSEDLLSSKRYPLQSKALICSGFSA
jgi:hypothetical protein